MLLTRSTIEAQTPGVSDADEASALEMRLFAAKIGSAWIGPRIRDPIPHSAPWSKVEISCGRGGEVSDLILLCPLDLLSTLNQFIMNLLDP